MTVSITALVAATLAERIDVDAGVRLLGPLVALGVASVLWWSISAGRGAEDLVPYIVVQFGSIALLLLMAALFPSRYTHAPGLLPVIALYGAAKAAEHFDEALFAFGSMLSGHSLKHLLAAAAVYQILRILKARSMRTGLADGTAR